MSDGLEDISLLVARRLEETDVLVQLERGMAERNETPVDNVKFLLFNTPVFVEDLFNASRPAWSISSARGQEEQGSARKPSVSDWKNVAALYELNGGNEQGKLEMASSLSVEICADLFPAC